jgi:hypothetical protein
LKLDHKILIPGNSSRVEIQPIMNGKNWKILLKDKEYSFPKEDVIILRDYAQTSCENIAEYLHIEIVKRIKKMRKNNRISQITITLGETVGNEVAYAAKMG